MGNKKFKGILRGVSVSEINKDLIKLMIEKKIIENEFISYYMEHTISIPEAESINQSIELANRIYFNNNVYRVFDEVYDEIYDELEEYILCNAIDILWEFDLLRLNLRGFISDKSKLKHLEESYENVFKEISNNREFVIFEGNSVRAIDSWKDYVKRYIIDKNLFLVQYLTDKITDVQDEMINRWANYILISHRLSFYLSEIERIKNSKQVALHENNETQIEESYETGDPYQITHALLMDMITKITNWEDLSDRAKGKITVLISGMGFDGSRKAYGKIQNAPENLIKRYDEKTSEYLILLKKIGCDFK
jgi:hypothetical protein